MCSVIGCDTKTIGVCRIKVNYKVVFLGYFTDIKSAISSRKDAELKYFGESLNFGDKDEKEICRV